MGKMSILTSLLYIINFYILTKFFGINGSILSPITTHLLIFPYWIKTILNSTNLSLKKYFTALFKSAGPLTLTFGTIYYVNYFLLKVLFQILLIELILIGAIIIFLDLKSKNSIIRTFKEIKI